VSRPSLLRNGRLLGTISEIISVEHGIIPFHWVEIEAHNGNRLSCVSLLLFVAFSPKTLIGNLIGMPNPEITSQNPDHAPLNKAAANPI